MGTRTFKDLQKEVSDWNKKNFPNAKPYQALLGVMEEVGELSHAHLKHEQGIRIDENHEENAKDAIGDIIIYLAAYCYRNGYDLEDIMVKTWGIVKQRDWTKHKVKGVKQFDMIEDCQKF